MLGFLASFKIVSWDFFFSKQSFGLSVQHSYSLNVNKNVRPDLGPTLALLLVKSVLLKIYFSYFPTKIINVTNQKEDSIST